MAEKYGPGEHWKTGSTPKRERMEIYAEWLSTPKDEREPATKTELAASLGCTIQTLINYEKEMWLQKEVLQRSRGLFKVERAQDVINSLFEIATNTEKGSAAVSAARLLLDWAQQGMQEGDEKNLDEYSDEDLIKALMERGNLDEQATG